ncbi:MAG: tRNA guanosine(34) transglycosylase Tgt [Candidatus Paceibacterota bacterium]|jgi:queuine tRNA-ribosyltransferase/7-cyano-7-deazaguanine tRNA-ribosyltransferase
MITFRIVKKSKRSRARLGIIQTPHGIVQTPSFVGVATQGTIKALELRQIKEVGTQLLIANTYHLHLRPGENVIKRAGGIHAYIGWQKPLMTDSGGFQVFSLGFGKDFGTGKILKQKTDAQIKRGDQPRSLKITEAGVAFKSYIDGSPIFLGPKESIRIQEKIGADIIFAFDECTSPIATHEYTKTAMERTHRWAAQCLKTKKTDQALYGIVQGGKYKDLRTQSARTIGALPFDGFGIGGEFGDDKRQMTGMIRWVVDELPEQKPRHLLGIGHLQDIAEVIKEGVDTFDCITPTHYARHGHAFIRKTIGTKTTLPRFERLDLHKSVYLKDMRPLDPHCSCFTCRTHSRSFIAHLLRAYEITPLILLTIHNLHTFNAYVADIRTRIKNGLL